jgi:hypothetical protein
MRFGIASLAITGLLFAFAVTGCGGYGGGKTNTSQTSTSGGGGY